MTLIRLFAATWVLIAVAALAACQQREPEPAKKAEAAKEHAITRLSVSVGSIWGGGYSVDVAPEQYVVVEHVNCPDAKEKSPFDNQPKGLCVVRITKEQSNRFEAAMERFKATAVPLETYNFDHPFTRPDGKPCKNVVTDSTHISLIWSGTQGVKIASFYVGCDETEFKDFYNSVLDVTDPLPVQQIIEER